MKDDYTANRVYLFSLPHLYWDTYTHTDQAQKAIKCDLFVSPFTPKSYQFQTSPATSPEISRHKVWRTCLYTAYSDARWLYYQFSHYLTYTVHFSSKGFVNLGVKGLSDAWCVLDQREIITAWKNHHIHNILKLHHRSSLVSPQLW